MIILFARPRFHFSTGEDWTEIRIEGDTESGIANIISATLLAAKFEVAEGQEETDPIEELPE